MTWPVNEPGYGTFDWLGREVGGFLEYGHDAGTWNHEQEGVVRVLVQRGVWQFYRAHDWDFLHPVTTLTTTAPYATGTIEVVAGVVTLTGGTWPTWAAQGELRTGGNVYLVSTRDSGTQLTLTDLTVAIAAGEEYALARPAYELPADYGGIEGELTYPPGSTNYYGPIPVVGEGQIRELQLTNTAAFKPRYATVRPTTTDGTAAQLFEIVFFPSPDAEYRLSYRYQVNPQLMTTTAKYPYGGQQHYETILLSCLALAEIKRDKTAGVHNAAYAGRVAESVKRDRKDNTPETLGYNGDPGIRRMPRRGRRDHGWCDYAVTYNGVRY